MNKPELKTEFDERDRQAIRRRLQRYVEDHGIGAPTLCKRIEKADPRGRELPLSNLQRFLSDSHRTLDLYVAMITAFLDTVASKNEDWATDQFGDALARFVAAARSTPADDKLRTALPGAYRRIQQEGGPAAGNAAPELTIGVPTEGGYLPVAGMRRGDRGAHQAYEGALAVSDGLVFIVMRSALTRLPLIYWLERAEAAVDYDGTYLVGQVSETLFRAQTAAGERVTSETILITSGG